MVTNAKPANRGASPLSSNSKHLLAVTHIATRRMGNNINICCSKNKVNCGIFSRGLVFCASYSTCPLIFSAGFCHIWSDWW